MNLGVLILIALLGIGFVIAEVFFVSFGILSILASLCLVGSIFLAYRLDTSTGHVFLVGTAVAVPLAILWALRWLPRTRIGRILLLSGPEHEKVTRAAEEPGLHELLNKHGVAVSPLRPSGIARIDGRRVDVVTRGEMIDRDVPLRVIEVLGNRVVVRRDDPQSAPSS